LIIGLSMTHPEDDDNDIADHGTVIMDRKAASGIARSAVNPSRSRPSPPPNGSVSGTPSTPAVSPSGLPVVPHSLGGLGPSSAASNASSKRLAALVAFGSFTVVFVIGALIMILIRVARDSAEDGSRSNNSGQTKPAPVNSSRGPGK
jgi:hypothetical protein